MKKVLLTMLAGALTTLSMQAQTVDYGFETWADVANAKPGVQDPKGWASFNILTNPLVNMVQTVFKETAAPYAGTAAAKIVTQVIPNNLVPGYDTVGVLAIGVVSLSPAGIKAGTTFVTRPAIFNFATKYQPVTGDSASVTIQLTKFNTSTSKIDVVASGQWKSTASSSTWTLQTVNLTYDPIFSNVAPDSIKILVSSSSLYGRPKVGSILYIDEIVASGWVSTNDINGVKNNVLVYPMPAKENVSFTSSLKAQAVQVMDITGRNVGTYQMINNKVTVETLSYKSGMYLYNVLDNQNKVLSQGKFEVVK